MMNDNFVLLSVTLPKLNICFQPLPLIICCPASLDSIISVCITHGRLVVTCDNIPTIGAGAQTPANPVTMDRGVLPIVRSTPTTRVSTQYTEQEWNT